MICWKPQFNFIGLLVYLVYRFISPLFIFPCVLSINQINRFISPCVLSLDSGIVSGLLVYLVYWFISLCTLSLDSFRNGQWDSVQFIGLFGLLLMNIPRDCLPMHCRFIEPEWASTVWIVWQNVSLKSSNGQLTCALQHLTAIWSLMA